MSMFKCNGVDHQNKTYNGLEFPIVFRVPEKVEPGLQCSDPIKAR